MQMDEKQRRRRVLNVLAATRGGAYGLKAKAVRELLKRFPEARAVRFEDKCPICKRAWLLSFVMDHDTVRDGQQTCGYFCAACNWSNAGSRAL